MKVCLAWLLDLVNLKIPLKEVERLLPLRTIGIKEVTPDFIELDMKGYNRADLLSMRGVAYETAAITNSLVNFSEENLEKITRSLEKIQKIQLEVNAKKAVPLYCIAKIEGLKVDSSPQKWVKKLSDSGMRSINNIIDVTNLIMLEYGQPMHAFAADKVSGETIIVRTAQTKEKLITLDNKERVLTTTDLVIADPKKALGLAGVMGGKNSEVTDQTKTILLEAAIFDPVAIRKTTQRLNLPSEASKRFQHGLTKTRLLQALAAAIRIYEELGGRLTALTIKGDSHDDQPLIKLSLEHLNALAGIKFEPKFVQEVLEKLHFQVKNLSPQSWEVKPPFWRLDVKIEIDVIEEIARLYGYENIPAQPLAQEKLFQTKQDFFDLIRKIKHDLVSLGLTEIQTYSFYSSQVIQNLNLDKNKLVRVANPMSKETEYLRNMLWPNLLEVAAQNIKKYHLKDLGLFEIGKVYLFQEGEKPKEETRLAIILSGSSHEIAQELFTIFAKLAEKLNLSWKIKVQEVTEEEKNFFHPYIYASIQDKGFLAEVNPRITNSFGLEEKVVVGEVRLSS